MTLYEISKNFVQKSTDIIRTMVPNFDEDLAIKTVEAEINKIGIAQFNAFGKDKTLSFRWINYLFGAIRAEMAKKSDAARKKTKRDKEESIKNNPDYTGCKGFFGGGIPPPPVTDINFSKSAEFFLAQHKVIIYQDANGKPIDESAVLDIIKKELEILGKYRLDTIGKSDKNKARLKNYLLDAIYFQMGLYK